MQITEVKVFPVSEDKLKAFVSIVLDSCFMINDIKVISGREGLFISMPSRRKKNGEFKDVAHPLNNQTRAWLEDRVLGEYARTLEAEGDTPQPARRVPTSGPARAEAAASPPAVAEAEDEGQEEKSLEEVRRKHLSDAFWNVG